MDQTNSLKIRNKEESALCSGLYLVPTPIGNLRDMTLRALDVLNACDVLVCEDARVSGKLLKSFDIKVPKKVTYNDHADDEVKKYILSLIADEKIVAMVSDAGTPMISDPGYKLVRSCVERDFYVTALPGANAVLPAIQLSGFSTNSFEFKGFLSNKYNQLKKEINNLINVENVNVFSESPKRIEKTLSVFDEIMPDRNLVVVREISKMFEEVYRGTASEILNQMTGRQVKGEIALVVDGRGDDQGEDYDLDKMILQAHESGEKLKDLSASIASIVGMKKKDVYNHALKILEK
jgi:16S rRNA (cytidine1402-2'-O)-methyltransferase